jgi:hypothetical protein
MDLFSSSSLTIDIMNYHEHGVTFKPGNLGTVAYGVDTLNEGYCK